MSHGYSPYYHELFTYYERVNKFHSLSNGCWHLNAFLIKRICVLFAHQGKCHGSLVLLGSQPVGNYPSESLPISTPVSLDLNQLSPVSKICQDPDHPPRHNEGRPNAGSPAWTPAADGVRAASPQAPLGKLCFMSPWSVKWELLSRWVFLMVYLYVMGNDS